MQDAILRAIELRTTLALLDAADAARTTLVPTSYPALVDELYLSLEEGTIPPPSADWAFEADLDAALDYLEQDAVEVEVDAMFAELELELELGV